MGLHRRRIPGGRSEERLRSDKWRVSLPRRWPEADCGGSWLELSSAEFARIRGLIRFHGRQLPLLEKKKSPLAAPRTLSVQILFDSKPLRRSREPEARHLASRITSVS